MERILVGIDSTRPSWEALLRALCLAPRIQARVSVLVVFPPDGGAGGKPAAGKDTPEGRAVRRRVDSEIESAKAAGANVDLFVAEGRYERELIGAAGQLKTTLLVAAAAGGDGEGGEREAELLGTILNGVDCRVELVSPKRHHERERDGA
ncbi:MAG: universal stress protein [Acidobacteriota bacterium]